MSDYLPLLISALALLAAVIPLPGFRMVRWSLAIFALGSGQIYLAFAGFGLLLLIENSWHFDLQAQGKTVLVALAIMAIVIGLTLLSPFTSRTYSELAQLLVYILVFFLLLSFIKSGEEIMFVLKTCLWGALATITAAFLFDEIGLAQGTFIGRGANEGAVFLALLGVVPAVNLFVRSRNPLYLVTVALFVMAQTVSTSRGSLVVSGVALLCGLFFVTRQIFIRIAFVAIGVFVLFTNVPTVMQLYQSQLNFSARERLALIQYGWDLSQEKFWTGWGWGSTNALATAAPTVNVGYPHFHNGYIQMLVELGLFGWILLGGFFYFALSRAISALRIRRAQVSGLIAINALAISISFIFDAMLFGADRVVQIIILFALMVRTSDLALRQQPKQLEGNYIVTSELTAGVV